MAYAADDTRTVAAKLPTIKALNLSIAKLPLSTG